jgi:anti-sigma factor RsiW
MKDFCSSVSKLLDKYFDQEATDKERSLVETHLAVCPTCQDTLKCMGDFRDLLKVPVEAALQREDFERAWQNISREIRIREKPSWQESIRSWLNLAPILRKKVWVPAVAVAAILILLTTQVFFEETPSYVAMPDVEYVDSSYNVMVYPMEKGKITVIWLFEGDENEAAPS